MSVSHEAREAALAAASASLGERIDLIGMWAGQQDDHPLVQAFQRVIDNERERCAAFVQAWNGETLDGDTSLIATAIREGAKG